MKIHVFFCYAMILVMLGSCAGPDVNIDTLDPVLTISNNTHSSLIAFHVKNDEGVSYSGNCLSRPIEKNERFTMRIEFPGVYRILAVFQNTNTLRTLEDEIILTQGDLLVWQFSETNMLSGRPSMRLSNNDL